MKKPVTISVNTPCYENWNAMSRVPNGRFCNACETAVVDFSEMTDAQIYEYFKNAKGKVCGHFKTSQLQRPLQPLHSATGIRFRSWLLGLSLTILGTGTGYSRTGTKGQVSVFQQPGTEKKAFKVQLINGRNGSPVSGVSASAGHITRFSATDGVADFFADTSGGARVVLHLSAAGYAPVVFVSEVSALDSVTLVVLDPIEMEATDRGPDLLGKVAYNKYHADDTIQNTYIRVQTESGIPLKNVRVSEPGAEQLGFTDSNGYLHIAFAHNPGRLFRFEVDGYKTVDCVIQPRENIQTIVLNAMKQDLPQRQQFEKGEVSFIKD